MFLEAPWKLCLFGSLWKGCGARMLRLTTGSCQFCALATIIYIFTSSIPTASAMALSLLNLFTDWLLLCVKVPIFGNTCSHYIWRYCIMRALHVTVFMVCMLSSGGNYPHSVPLMEARPCSEGVYYYIMGLVTS